MKKSTQKTYATNVFNEWNSEEITNIVIPEDSDQETCHTNDMVNQPKGVMGKLFSQTIKHNNIDDSDDDSDRDVDGDDDDGLI